MMTVRLFIIIVHFAKRSIFFFFLLLGIHLCSFVCVSNQNKWIELYICRVVQNFTCSAIRFPASSLVGRCQVGENAQKEKEIIKNEPSPDFCLWTRICALKSLVTSILPISMPKKCCALFYPKLVKLAKDALKMQKLRDFWQQPVETSFM